LDKKIKNIVFMIIVLVIAALILENLLYTPQEKEISYSEFSRDLRDDKVTKLQIIGLNVIGEWTSSQPTDVPGQSTQKFHTKIHPMFADLIAKEIDSMMTDGEGNLSDVVAQPEPENRWWFELLVNWFPFIFFILLWFYILNKMNGAGSKAMSFGKSRAKFIDPSAEKTSFKDVAGCDEAKFELVEVIEFLKDPKKFQRLGGKIPKGVLLVGPPGTGKTLLARAVAGEAKVPFLHISGSDFVEMFVGVGASRVRDLFDQAKKQKPCIVFIDEIDAVGRQRGAGLGGGHDEREQTLNQLLVQMDGFAANQGIVVIAATNRPDILDPALLRPGRFDRQVHVDLPDIKGRYEILKVHTREIPLNENVKLKKIARTTPGLSGADIANLVNESALLAARENSKTVMHRHFEEARDKVTMGVERKSKVISEEEKEITAYHEAGHALIAKLIKNCDPLHKVSIIPRGMALGVTHSIPERDRYLYSKEKFLAIIKKAFGGRIAEELKFNLHSTGASNDISVATNIAHSMVCVYGMSEKMGPISFGKREQHIFLGRELSQTKDFSEKTAYEIDQEVKKIMTTCYEEAKKVVADNMDKLEAIAQGLLKYETLTVDEVDKLIDGEDIEKDVEARKSLDEIKDEIENTEEIHDEKEQQEKIRKNEDIIKKMEKKNEKTEQPEKNTYSPKEDKKEDE